MQCEALLARQRVRGALLTDRYCPSHALSFGAVNSLQLMTSRVDRITFDVVIHRRIEAAVSSAVLDSTQLTPAERCMILLLPALGQGHVLADTGAPPRQLRHRPAGAHFAVVCESSRRVCYSDIKPTSALQGIQRTRHMDSGSSPQRCSV